MANISSELSTRWRKSSFSLTNGECVELARLVDGDIGLRDSKNPDGPVLRFSPREVDAFIRGVLGGEFDEFR